jgi:hypothetical protein
MGFPAHPWYLEIRLPGGRTMPFVTIKTGFPAPDGGEETLTEYLCDWPGCPNIAVHTLGCIVEIRAFAAVCEEHVPLSQKPTTS